MNTVDNGNENGLLINKNTIVGRYIDWLSDSTNTDISVMESKEKLKIQGNEDDVFLSVISRTQGKRPEAFREMLLSLSGQSCTDFEVLIMGHNLTKEQSETVEAIVDETPEYLRNRIRIIPVTGGNRTRPINRGFEEARGKYAVLLDDDDLVFDHWVACFKEKYEECPGMVLHSYVIAQKWQMLEDKNGERILRAAGSPMNQYCCDFDWFCQIRGNSCPVLGLAFPLYPFRNYNICFDESLDTTEDWDFLMRISALCGVANIQEPTSIYRLWENAENSYSIYSTQHWNENRDKIRKKIENRPMVLPQESVKKLMEIVDENPGIFMKKRNVSAEVTPLYYDNGSGFNEKCSKRSQCSAAFPNIQYVFTELGNAPIKSLRWDPSEYKDLYVEDPLFQIYTKKGKVIEKRIRSIHGNGFAYKNKIVFFHPDPQMVISLNRAIEIEKVVVTCKMSYTVTEEIHNQLSMWYDANIFSKGKKAAKIAVKKVVKKIKKV